MFISISGPATTADCKQLLALKEPAKRWTRVTKFKQGSAWFRIFKDELAAQYAVVVETLWTWRKLLVACLPIID